MLCSKWWEKKDVTMLSTIHKAVFVETGKTDREGKKIEKPEAAFYYCLRMGGVDLSDQLLNYFTFLRKSTKWLRKLLIHLFNLVILNAHILNKHYGCMKLTQDEYRGHIVKYLVSEGLKCYKIPLLSITSKKLGKHNTDEQMTPDPLLCGELFLWCRNILVLQLSYKYPEHPCDLRKDRLDTRLFTPTPCNGTSQVWRVYPLLSCKETESMLRRLL